MYLLRINFKSIKKIQNIEKKLEQIKTEKKSIFNIKNRNKIYTILKSPHVNKKSREHFNFKKNHKRVDLNFKNFFELFNTILIIRKRFSENFLINFKIIEN